MADERPSLGLEGADPYGVLDGAAILHPPPNPVAAQELAAEALPGAWRDGETNGVALTQALSQSRRTTLPWGLVRDGIGAGVDSRWLEIAEGSAPVGRPYDQAGQLRLKRPAAIIDPPPPPPVPAVTGALLDGPQDPGPRGVAAEAHRRKRRK